MSLPGPSGPASVSVSSRSRYSTSTPRLRSAAAKASCSSWARSTQGSPSKSSWSLLRGRQPPQLGAGPVQHDGPQPPDLRAHTGRADAGPAHGRTLAVRRAAGAGPWDHPIAWRRELSPRARRVHHSGEGRAGADRCHRDGCPALPHVDLVVVCDDGSSDATGEHAAAAGAIVVRTSRNRGKAAAVESAVNALGVLEQRDRRPEAARLLLLDADLPGRPPPAHR